MIDGELNSEYLEQKIQTAFRKVCSAWNVNLGMILSEDDFKVRLMFEMKEEIPEVFESRFSKDDEIKTCAIHTEVKFFDENDELSIKPDISILNPDDIAIESKSLRSSYQKALHPGKGFVFSGPGFVIELKFIKNPSGLTLKKDLDAIRKDLIKIGALNRRNGTKGMVLVLVKGIRSKIDENFSEEYAAKLLIHHWSTISSY